MLKRIGKWLLGGLGLVLAVVAVLAINALWFKPFFIRVFFERAFIQAVFEQPELLTQLRLLEPLGIQGHNAKLDDASEAFATEQIAQGDADLAMLHSYDRASLTGQPRLSYDVLDWYLTSNQRGNAFRYDNYPVNQLFGVQSGFPTFMAAAHQVHNLRDASFYNTRLKLVGRKFGQVIEGLKVREQHGVVPPTFVLDKVLAEMRAFVGAAPKQNILYTALAEKMAKVDDLTTQEKAGVLAATEQQIQQQVYPAYRQLIAFCAAQRGRSTNDAGVWKFPDGAQYYAWALRNNTTTDYTPEQVHQLGLREVARISAEMRAILHQQGYAGDSVGRLMQRLGTEARFLFADNDSGRAQILAGYRHILSEVNAGLDPAFRLRPRARLTVERVPVFKQKTTPGAYYDGPALDGSRPGTFYANLYDVTATPRYEMRTLAYHEGIPGHHFQIGIAQELTGLPTFRTLIPFTAYVEGWALYAERLAWEMGFEKDPYDNLGRLQAELFRAVRLVVDTGLHYKRWTREEAIRYMQATTGMAESEVVAEIERYIVMPGQACAYKVGMLRILELRAHAQQALGPKFDLRDFHAVVLQNGALPLTLLEQVVDQYIAGKQKG